MRFTRAPIDIESFRFGSSRPAAKNSKKPEEVMR